MDFKDVKVIKVLEVFNGKGRYCREKLVHLLHIK